MKWIYWLLVAVIIIGLSQEASAGHRKKRSERYRHRHRNLLKGGNRRFVPKRKYNDYDDYNNADDYYDSLHLGRQNTPEKTEIIEEENSESNANQSSTIPSNSKFDGIDGADSERSGLGASNPVFTAFLTKKQDILNAFTSSTSTSTTSTTTSTTAAPLTQTFTITATGTGTLAPARDANDPTGDDDAIVQRVQQNPGRQKQVLVQYRPIVVRQVNRRRQPGNNVNRLQPIVLPGNFGGFGGQMIRVPVRLAKI